MNRDKKGNWSDWEDGELPSEFAVAEVPSCGDAVDEVKAGSECKAREVAEGRFWRLIRTKTSTWDSPTHSVITVLVCLCWTFRCATASG